MPKRFSKTFLFIALVGVTAIAITPVYSEDDIVLDPKEETIPEQKVIESPAIAPKWEEFCETGYENVNSTEKKDIFDIFSFVKSERVKKNYWASRRESFDKYLKYCNTISNETEKGVCYSELRKIENEKNDEYKIQRKELIYQHNIRIDK